MITLACIYTCQGIVTLDMMSLSVFHLNLDDYTDLLN